jgi:hypothetical protein
MKVITICPESCIASGYVALQLDEDRLQRSLLDFDTASGRFRHTAVRGGSKFVGHEFDAFRQNQAVERMSAPVEALSQSQLFLHRGTANPTDVPKSTPDPSCAAVWSNRPVDGEGPHQLPPFEHLHRLTLLSLKARRRSAGFGTSSTTAPPRRKLKLQARGMQGRKNLPRQNTTAQYLQSTLATGI